VEIYHLHCSVSEVEFEGKYREVSGRWRIDFPEFSRYFNLQWILVNFTNWKIYCSELGIASTNNALESFNNVIKRCYTLNARHSLSALVDLFMEQLVFDISMDVKDLHKCYELCHLPSVEVKQKSEAFDENNYVIREERNGLVTYQKHGNNEVYHMNCLNGTCTCKYYMKMGYYSFMYMHVCSTPITSDPYQLQLIVKYYFPLSLSPLNSTLYYLQKVAQTIITSSRSVRPFPKAESSDFPGHWNKKNLHLLAHGSTTLHLT